MKENKLANYKTPEKQEAKFISSEFRHDFVKSFESLIFKDVSLENIKYTDVSHVFFSNQISPITEDFKRILFTLV